MKHVPSAYAFLSAHYYCWEVGGVTCQFTGWRCFAHIGHNGHKAFVRAFVGGSLRTKAFFACAFQVKHDPSGKVGPCVFFHRLAHISHRSPAGRIWKNQGFGFLSPAYVFMELHCKHAWYLFGLFCTCFRFPCGICRTLPRIPCAGWGFVVTCCSS